MFLFLAAVIVIVATIFLGGKLFGLFSGSACSASEAQFRSDVLDALDANSQFGSRSTVTLPAPCGAVTLCFVDVSAIGNVSFASDDSVMTAAVRNGAETNIFLRTDKGMLESGYDERIVTDNDQGYMCFSEVRGAFSFRTEGKGRFVEIHEGTA